MDCVWLRNFPITVASNSLEIGPLFFWFPVEWFNIGTTLASILNRKACLIAKNHPSSNTITFILCSLNKCENGTKTIAHVLFAVKAIEFETYAFIPENSRSWQKNHMAIPKYSIIVVAWCIMWIISRFRLRSSIEWLDIARSPPFCRSIVTRSSFLSNKIIEIVSEEIAICRKIRSIKINAYETNTPTSSRTFLFCSEARLPWDLECKGRLVHPPGRSKFLDK